VKLQWSRTVIVYANISPEIKPVARKLKFKIGEILPVARKLKFKIGDRVRISRKRKNFDKGYFPNFTRVIFVLKLLETKSVTYRLKDKDGEEVIGSFYGEELSKYSRDAYKINKIPKNSKGKLLVKWKKYDDPSLIPKAELI
jgi:hypothetical protein